jgi:hypothetical protein
VSVRLKKEGVIVRGKDAKKSVELTIEEAEALAA